MKKRKAIALLSGGMDSLVTLALAREENDWVYVIHMNYGQKTMAKEKECFDQICDHYQIPLKHRLTFDQSALGQIGGSSLTDPSMEVTQANLDTKEIPTSYVPFRNAHMVCLAVSWAEVVGANRIYIGAVEEDSSGYPDCRQSFYQVFNQLIDEGTKPETQIEILTPLIHMRKSDIILKAKELNAPLEYTWSCYKRMDQPCGECDSCALRARGFKDAGIIDPIQ